MREDRSPRRTTRPSGTDAGEHSRRAFLAATAGGVTLAAGATTVALAADGDGTAASGSFDVARPESALVVDDFDRETWPGENALGNYTAAGDLENDTGDLVSTVGGSGAGEVPAIRLEYDGNGWLMSNVRQSVSAYSHLVLVVAGEEGGEESDIQLEVGGVEGMLPELTDDTVGTDLAPVAVDLEAAGVDQSAVDAVDLNFWQGGAGAVELAEIRFESAGSGPPVVVGEAPPTDPDSDGDYEDLNGNEEVDFDDVVTYFNSMDDPALTDHTDAYDYNGNSEIDFADVVALFGEV